MIRNKAIYHKLLEQNALFENFLQEMNTARGQLKAEVTALRLELQSKIDAFQEEVKNQTDTFQEEVKTLRLERENLLQEQQTLRTEIKNAEDERDAALQDKFKDALRSPEKEARFFDIFIAELLQKNHHSVFWGDRLLSLDKTAGFWEERKFADLFEQISDSHIYDQYTGPDGIAWRLHTLVWAARSTRGLPGDFVECGVFKGDMSWVVANIVDFAKEDRVFYLYDSFEGFSPQYSSKDDFPLNPEYLEYANKFYQLPDLFEQVQERFKEFPNVKVIKGFLPDSLSQAAPERIAYLHLDLNSPVAEVSTLEILFDRVVTGGIVILDDYGWFEFLKQKRAADEFMQSRGYSLLELPTGQGVVVKR
jgi:hypothetical protein